MIIVSTAKFVKIEQFGYIFGTKTSSTIYIKKLLLKNRERDGPAGAMIF